MAKTNDVVFQCDERSCEQRAVFTRNFTMEQMHESFIAQGWEDEGASLYCPKHRKTERSNEAAPRPTRQRKAPPTPRERLWNHVVSMNAHHANAIMLLRELGMEDEAHLLESMGDWLADVMEQCRPLEDQRAS